MALSGSHSGASATRSALGRAHVPPTKMFRRLAVNKTILKPRVAAATGGQYVYMGFSRRNKIPRSSAYTISKKAIRFRHPEYNLDRAQKLISSSMSRHLSTRNISSKSMHAFLVILLTDRQTNEHGQKHVPPPLSEVITRSVAAGFGRHGMLPSSSSSSSSSSRSRRGP